MSLQSKPPLFMGRLIAYLKSDHFAEMNNNLAGVSRSFGVYRSSLLQDQLYLKP
jgi:hypothetical protein